MRNFTHAEAMMMIMSAGGGATQPPQPAGSAGDWLAYKPSYFSLVNGDQTEDWLGAEGVGATLTQSTSLDQPTLFEDKLLTQRIVAEQPSFDWDSQVTQDTVAEQPTLVDTGGGIRAMRFDLPSKSLNNYPNVSTNFAIEMLTRSDSLSKYIVRDGASATRLFYNADDTTFDVSSIEGTRVKFTLNTSGTIKNKIRIEKNGNAMECFQDDVSLGTHDVTGLTYETSQISGQTSNAFEGDIFYIKQFNLDISSTIPTHTFDASAPETLRNASLEQASVGEQIQGWRSTTAVLAMRFDFDSLNEQSLKGLPIGITNPKYLIEVNIEDTGDTQKIFTSSSTPADGDVRIQSTGIIRVRSDQSVNFDFNGGIFDTKTTYEIIIDGNDLEVLVNGVSKGIQDFTGNTLSNIDTIGDLVNAELVGDVFLIEVYDLDVSTETPTFTLLPTVESIPSGIGAQAPKWYAQEHNKYKNRSVTTPTQYMENYPTVAGDVTHLRAIEYNTLGTLKKDYSHSTGSAWMGANASDRYEAVSDLGTSFVYDTLAVTLEHNQTAWVIRGTELELWYLGNLIESKDITGETFTVDRYGASANSADGTTEWKHIYFSALAGADIPWFSYLRNETTNLILLPPIWPDPIPPIQTFPVNSLTLPASTDYITGTKSSALELEHDQSWSIRVKPSDITGVNQLFTLNYNAPSARTTNLRFLAGNLEFLGYPTVGVNSFVMHTSSETFAINDWVHIVITTDSNTFVNIYVNGVKEVFGGIGSSSGNDPLLDLAIGTVTGGGVGGNKINRVQVWDRAISDAEVLEDYNGSTTEYVSYDKQVLESSTLITGKIFDSDLEDASLVEHTGNSTLTAIGTPTYTNQGMTKTV